MADDEKISTLNDYVVTASAGRVVAFAMRQTWTPETALRLAAWLVVGAELAGHPKALERFGQYLEAIKAT